MVPELGTTRASENRKPAPPRAGRRGWEAGCGKVLPYRKLMFCPRADQSLRNAQYLREKRARVNVKLVSLL